MRLQSGILGFVPNDKSFIPIEHEKDYLTEKNKLFQEDYSQG